MYASFKNGKLPKIAFGTWSWGAGDKNSGKTVFGNDYTSADALKPVFDLAYEQGYTLWDTAYVYDFGGAEDLLRQCADGRDYFLSDKFTPLPGQTDGEVRRILEGSLKRLNRDCMDLYWIHTPADVERWTKELIPLLKEGLIRHVGVSNHSLYDIEYAQSVLQAAGYCISAVQNHCSLIYRNSIKSGVVDWCRRNGAVFMPYMILEQGALTGRFTSENPFPAESRRGRCFPPETLDALQPLVADMTALGKKHGGADASQIAMAWAISKGMLPIIGATKKNHIQKAIDASSIVLSDEEMMDLEIAADRTGISVRASWEKEM